MVKSQGKMYQLGFKQMYKLCSNPTVTILLVGILKVKMAYSLIMNQIHFYTGNKVWGFPP